METVVDSARVLVAALAGSGLIAQRQSPHRLADSRWLSARVASSTLTTKKHPLTRSGARHLSLAGCSLGQRTPEGEMHLVWASPGTASAYRLDNRFADGVVLVKEVLAGEHGRMTRPGELGV